MIKFDTLAQIQAHEFVGCHAFDHEAFTAIEQFALNEAHPIADRAEALRVMGREGMGLTPEENLEHMPDDEFIQDFLDTYEA